MSNATHGAFAEMPWPFASAEMSGSVAPFYSFLRLHLNKLNKEPPTPPKSPKTDAVINGGGPAKGLLET